jgi:hypothetical protein
MSTGLVQEIQKAVIDPDASVSSLLRKVKLAAAKLQLSTVEAWVDDELKGYNCDGDKLPKYRQGQGTIKIWNPYHGWQPLGGHAETLMQFSRVYMWDPIAAFENIPRGKNGGVTTYPFNPTKLEILSKLTGSDIARGGVDIPHGALVAVIDTVRTLILEWAIELEKAGITGEGMSFSNEEKKSAQASDGLSMHIGSIGTFTGVLGAQNTAGDITSSVINVEKAEHLVSQVKANSGALISEGVKDEELKACLSALDSALKKSDQSLLRKGLEMLRAIVLKTSTGLVSTGILTMLHQVLGTGVAA